MIRPPEDSLLKQLDAGVDDLPAEQQSKLADILECVGSAHDLTKHSQ